MRRDRRAVSPVVGVMLMLVVAVVLAAVVNSFAGGLVGTQKKTPQASFDVKIRSKETTGWTPEFVMKHLGGDPVDTDSVKLVTKWYNESTGKWEIQETTAVPLSDNAVIYYDEWIPSYRNASSGVVYYQNWTYSYTNESGTDNAITVSVDLSNVTCSITEVRLYLLNSSGNVVDKYTETKPGTGFSHTFTVTANDTYNITVNYTTDSGYTSPNWTSPGIPVSTSDDNETHVYLSLTARCTRDDAINVSVDLSDIGTCNITEFGLKVTRESDGKIVNETVITNPPSQFWINFTVDKTDRYNFTVNYTAVEGSGPDYQVLSLVPVDISDNNETHVYLKLTVRCTRYADVNTEYNDTNSATTLYHVPYLVVPGDMPADGKGKETELWFGNYVIQKGDVIKAQINLNTGTGPFQNQRTPIIANATYLKPGDVVIVELIDLTTNNKIFSKEVVVQ